MPTPAVTAPSSVAIAGNTRPAQSGFAAYLLRSAAASWMANLLAILYAFFITPIVIRALHQELYGVWSYLNGLLAYSNLFYLGLGSAFVKYMAQYRGAGNHASANRLASVVFVIYGAIGVVCVAICILVAPWVPRMFAEPIGEAATQEAVIACMLLGFRLFFMFIATVYSGVLAGSERIASATAVSTSLTVVRFAAVPVLIGYGRPLVMLATIMTVTAGVESMLLALAAWKLIPDVRIRPARPRMPELQLLYGFGLKSFFILLSAWLVNYTDTTVIGIRLGAASVALYSIPLQLVAYGRVGVQGMVSALLPRLTIYQAQGDHEAMREAYLRVSRAANFLGAFVAFNLVTLGAPFIAIWVGHEFAAAGTLSLILLALAGFCQVVSTQTSVPFFQAMHAFRAPVLVLLLEAGINLWLSIWLAATMGISGVALATLIPAVAASSVLLPRALCRSLTIPVRRYFVGAVLPSLVLLTVGMAVNYALNSLMYPRSYDVIVLRSVCNAALAFGIAAVALPAEDHLLFKRLVWYVRARCLPSMTA